MRTAPALFFGAAVLLFGAASWAQPVTVTYHEGLLSIQCVDAPLSSVFETIEEQAGIDLTLEDPVKSKKLTASLTDVPVAMAVQRLLEGVGVNYIVMMDPYDWGRVGKIFVGAGGGGPARGASGPRGPVMPEEPVEEAYEEMAPDLQGLEGMEGMEGDFGDAMDPGLEVPPEEMPQNPEEFGAPDDPGMFPTPPGSSPLPDFLPPTQAFPRSNFTPGLPNRQQPRATQPGAAGQTPEQDPNAPPAVFPFTDPFGRPIPIPPGMNQQLPPEQQQQQRRQQQQQQRQEQ